MDYRLFDADNHYYEVEDAFTRYGDDEVKRFVRWVSEGKRRHILFGNVMQTLVPNPTFNPITKPGAFHARLKELESGGGERGSTAVGMNDKSRYGVLEQLPAHYQERDSRLKVMDEQGLEGAFLFPTLGVGVEGLNAGNVRMTYKAFRAFNQWVEEDWGFAYQDRLYSAPAIPVLDPVEAAKELELVLSRGARIVVLRPGPANGRSPADPVWDPFWSLLNDSGVPAAYHTYGGGDAYDDAFRMLWQRHGQGDPAYEGNLRYSLFAGDRPMIDTAVALVLGNVFGRFPRLRVMSIELGAAWVPYVLHTLDHAGGIVDRHIRAFGEVVEELPSEVFKRHFWVAPFPEEDIAALAGLIGVDHVLFGSDFPHAEGTEQPADFARYLDRLDPADGKKIMRDNALALLRPPTF
ncbi:amidohydrolase family protein [Actinomadura sp. 3N508]|uniref:amidohydrolase family protein n=1 Tax=Actinomadura sp. 3N508 TaxID=3375153 RepID=UPI003792D032